MIFCVTNRSLCKADFLQQLRRIAAAKPDAIVLREKMLSEDAYMQMAEQVFSICQENQVQLICNTFIRVAERLAVPVQISFSTLSQTDSLSVPFGVSVHSVEEAIRAEQAGAAFLIAGHIFATACKPDLPPRGLLFLQEICQAVSIPVLGIGGIHVQNAASILQTGAAGFCIMSDFMQTDAPEWMMQQLRKLC